MSERRDYLFRYLPKHLEVSGQAESLFELLEETPFLDSQIRYLDGVKDALASIDRHALPAAIRCGDWRRFVQFALIARNIHAIGHELIQSNTAELASHERLRLLTESVASGDIHTRLTARAAILKTTPRDGKISRELLDEQRQDLGALSLPVDDIDAEAQFWVLFMVATEGGCEVENELRQLVSQRPAWKDRIWAGLAEGCSRREGADSEDAWRLLAEIEDTELLREILPILVVDGAQSDPLSLIERVDALPGVDASVSWLCGTALLGELAKSNPATALYFWREAAEGSVPWSIDLIEKGRDLFPLFTGEEIEELLATIDDMEVRAALSIVAARGNQIAARQCSRNLIAALPQGILRWRWQLRFWSEIGGDEEELQQEVRRLWRELEGNRLEVSNHEGRLLIDLVARAFPNDLSGCIESVLRAPGTNLGLIVEAIEESDQVPVLNRIFNDLESYLLLLGVRESLAFTAWQELIAKTTGRLCALRRDLFYLEQALPQFPDTDELRAVTAEQLASAGWGDLVVEVCSKIADRALAARTLMARSPQATYPRKPEDVAAMYPRLAAADSVESEIRGLMALSGEISLASLHKHYVRHTGNENGRTVWMSRWVRLALAHGSRFAWTRREASLVVESLGRVASSLMSDVQLAYLSPGLVEIAVLFDPARAEPETRECFEQVLALAQQERLPAAVARDVLEDLFARLRSLMSTGARDGHRRLSRLIRWMSERLTDWWGAKAEPDGLSLLPVLACAAEHAGCRLHRSRSAAEEIARRAARLLARSRSEERREAQLDRLEKLVSILTAESETLVQRGLTEAASDSEVLEASIYCLCGRRPVSAIECLSRLVPGRDRDELCVRLIRHGWLPQGLAGEALELVEEPWRRREAEVFLGLLQPVSTDEGDRWVGSLASLAVEKDIDLADPRLEPIARRLWLHGRECALQKLAEASWRALTDGQISRATNALILWLHAYLSPETPSISLQRGSGLLALIQQVSALPGAGRPTQQP